MNTNRQRVSFGAPWEQKVGYCRAVKAGSMIFVTGTVASPREGEGGTVYGEGDGYQQARRCIEIMRDALKELGADLSHVTRTRMFVTDIDRWEEFGRAHREFFGDHPPATTMVEVSRLISPEFLIEIEADAVLDKELD